MTGKNRRQVLAAMMAGALAFVASPAAAAEGAIQRAVRKRSRRRALIRDCEALVDHTVEASSGLTGVVLRGGYEALREARPTFVRRALEAFLDPWATRLDPIWADGGADALRSRADEVAKALLDVVDERAARADGGMVLSVFRRLRPHAEPFVVDAVDDLAAILDAHVS